MRNLRCVNMGERQAPGKLRAAQPSERALFQARRI